MADELVEVTQADRDAASSRLSANLAEGTIAMLLEGRLDSHPWVQAFARHRADGWREGVEAAAKWHDERARHTPDVFEQELHEVSAAALKYVAVNPNATAMVALYAADDAIRDLKGSAG